MTNITGTPSAGTQTLGVNSIFLIVGLACILGFTATLLTLAIPPDVMALEWRVGFMEQLSGRSIILFLGTALILYSVLEAATLVRYVALGCLVVGILLPMSCVLVVRDNLVMQTQAFSNVERQAQQMQIQLANVENSPELSADVTPEQLQAANQQIEARAEIFKQNARSRVSKSIVSIAGSLIVVGLGFLGLGRFGIRRSA